MIAVDDLNAWVGHLNAHPNTLTPNIDQLASEGVSFAHAYAPGTSCKPSRTAVLTGIRPVSSGIFNNKADESQLLEDHVTLPEYFEHNGYLTLATGKIFHLPSPEQFTEYYWGNGDYIWEKDEYTPATRQNGIDTLWDALDWGPISNPDAATPDMIRASWAAQQFKRDYDKPFFLSVGIYRPHLSWYVPATYFDKFPVSGLQLPPGVLEGDLLDVEPGGQMGSHWTHRYILEADAWYEAIQAYLASINYADAAVGIILDALDNSPYRDNTIVVLWGDHGWQLGEKERWSKETLWATSTRTTFVMRAPGLKSGEIIAAPVGLMSLFPTLVELAGLPKKDDMEASSLVPVLGGGAAATPVLSSNSPTEHAIRWERWSYLSHEDGTEQLYDMAEDPHEWNNLVALPQYQDQLIVMRGKLRELVP